jgi:pimeloyl-ACP methyl ester carboxylesterase
MSFVLIHGAGFGATCWDELIPHLNTQALAVDLPGRRTRVDVGLRAITLADCADAVREDVEAKDLRDVVLVGHSFAGVTVPRVLDLLPDRIRHVVLVSAVVPPDGSRVLRPDVIDLDTGHMAMISAPAELATVLNAIHG